LSGVTFRQHTQPQLLEKRRIKQYKTKETSKRNNKKSSSMSSVVQLLVIKIKKFEVAYCIFTKASAAVYDKTIDDQTGGYLKNQMLHSNTITNEKFNIEFYKAR
jgi:hypothetical protein